MPFPYELHRQDYTLLKNATAGDSRQVAAIGTLDIYFKGARVAAGFTASGTLTVSVYDIGTIRVGDTVQINANASTVGTVNAAPYTQTSLNITWAGPSIVAVVGDRLIISGRRPTAYKDAQGTDAFAPASQVTTGSDGSGSFYTRPRDIDVLGVVDTIAKVFPDQPGHSQPHRLEAFDFGLLADGSSDDAPAIQQAIKYAELAGLGKVLLPPGSSRIGSTLTLPPTPLVLEGSGRQVTSLTGIGASGTLVTMTSDHTLQAMTITRTVDGAPGSILVGVTGSRPTLRNLLLTRGAIGISDLGTVDGFFDDIVFSGGGWESFYVGGTTTRSHLRSLRGRYTNSLPATGEAILIGTNCIGTRLDDCDVGPSAPSTVTGTALEIGGTGSTDIVVSGGKFSGGKAAATARSGVIISGTPRGVKLIGCTIEASLDGYLITGGTDIQILGGTVVDMRQNGFNIDGGAHIQIIGGMSSDNNVANLADDRADHVNIAAGVDDVQILGLTVGRILIGGGIQARDGVRIEVGAGDRIQIMGLRGNIADLSNGWITNLSTSFHVDLSHNIEYAVAPITYQHHLSASSPVGGGAGVKTITAGSTSIDVSNTHLVRFLQAAPTAIVDLTGAIQGQRVTLVATNTNTTIADAAPFALNGAWAPNLDDSLTLVFVLSTWIEVARSPN